MKKACQKGFRFAKDITDYFIYGWKSSLFSFYLHHFIRQLTFDLNKFRHQLFTKRNNIKHIEEEKVSKLKKVTAGLHALLPPYPHFTYSLLLELNHPHPPFFRKTLQSIFDQTTSRLEVLIGSKKEFSSSIQQIIEEFKTKFPYQIQEYVVDSESLVFNELSQRAKGYYLLLMGQEDWIRPDLLFRYEQTLRMINQPGQEVLYCDENQINELDYSIPQMGTQKSSLHFPFFFTSFSERGLLIPKHLWDQVGGLCATYREATYIDLILRLEVAGALFQHIPICLYSQRVKASHSSQQIGSQQNLLAALSSYTRAKGLDWQWSLGYDSYMRAVPAIHHSHAIQVIVPFKDQKDLTLSCIRSVLKQKEVTLKITAVDNGSSDGSIAEELRALGVEVLTINEPFNYSRLNNLAVQQTQTASQCDLLLFLNNDVDLEEGALVEMVRWIDQPGIGMVGCRLHYPDGRLQHGGVHLDCYRLPTQMHWEHIEKLLTFDEMKQTKQLGTTHAVTAACALIKRQTFLDVKGFDEVWYPIAYSDTNLAVKLGLIGLACFYTPYAVGVHHESVSRKEGVEDYENSRWLHQLILKHHYQMPSNFFH